MQENPISNSLSKTDSNEASNPIRSLMPFRYGPLCYAIVDVEIGLTDHRIHDIGALRYDGAIFHKASKRRAATLPRACGVSLWSQHHPPRCQIPL